MQERGGLAGCNPFRLANFREFLIRGDAKERWKKKTRWRRERERKRERWKRLIKLFASTVSAAAAAAAVVRL